MTTKHLFFRYLGLLLLLGLPVIGIQLSYAIDLKKDLILHLNMDGNIQDHSGQGHHGTGGQVTFESSPIGGQAAFFNGNRSTGIKISNVSDFNFNNQSFSYSTWVKIYDHQSDYYRGYISLSNPNGVPRLDMAKGRGRAYSHKTYMQVYTGQQSMVLSNGTPPLHEWIHLASVIDYENKTNKFYVNGTLDSTKPLVDFNVSSPVLTIGSYSWYDEKMLGHYGLMDEVRIYGRALSESEVIKLAQAPFNCNQVTEIPQSECEALVALYDSTDGDNWTDNTGWKQTNTPCNWKGVLCSSGRIYSLALYHNKLSGELPSNLGNLSALSWINLGFNKLIGDIPVELGKLSRLSSLVLNDNQLSGEIPKELGNLNLQQILFTRNQLTGDIPTELGNIDTLQTLSLNNNQLTGEIPSELGSLSKLRYLYLNSNQLTGEIPSELGSLSSLAHLYLDNNQLIGEIPRELNNLSKIVDLTLNNNNLTGNIPNISQLTKLNIFRAEENSLNGELPDISQLTKLHIFHVGENNLSGAFPNISQLTELQNFHVGRSNLTGTFPDISSLTKLHTFNIEYNKLTGTLPNLSHLRDLFDFRVTSNQLSGTLPDLSGLTKLTYFVAGGNNFTGSVPSIDGLTALKGFFVHINKLTGNIPEFNNVPELNSYYVSDNKLDGTLPSSIQNLTNLTHLMVENNQFTGEFPALANLINLSELTVGGNAGLCRGNNIDYAGRAEVEALPFCEFSCSNVTEIPQSECEVLVNIYDDLGGDNWTNNVGWKQTNNPCTSWYNLGCKNGHVTDIALESNNLSGVIPDLIALTELETLPIGNNPNITGAIPEIGSLTKLYHFSIGNTGISGSIPSSILGATSLRELGLSDNPNLTGELPDFSQLPNLRELNLGGSGFTGAILSLPSNLTLFNVTGTDLCRDLSTDYGSYSQVNDLPICDFSCADVTQIPVNQCEALVDFYHSTNGDSWARSENWLETGTPCDWYGITCESGLLKGINLDNNNLTGTVSDLSGLTDLTGLYLHINKLTGNLPDWSQLVNLQTIYLQTNQFTGGIPSFSGLNKLSTIILYQNNLTGTVPDVSHLVYLVNFQMQTNELSGVLPEIKNLKHLIHFNVENNHFTGEIPDITGLTKLTTFRVAANLLTGSLPVLDDFSQLVTFSVNTNQLTGTIPEFGNVPKLDAYIVSNNNLIGSLPDSLRNLPSLTLLNVALNKLTGDISIISDLESIEVINLEHNHFEGELPSFSKLKWLEDIVLNGNNLTGGIPEINHLVHAWRLFLGVNYFEGVIPPMDQLELVTALNLNSKTNGICYSPNINYGKHAADIQQRYPQCSEEQLTAITCDDITEIPQDECQALEAIYTNTNGNDWTNNDWFKSKYPCNWHGVSCENGRVTAIDLDNNNLVGELPDELEVLTEMGVLSASGNKLEGDIPNLNALANLEKLDLSNNKLTSNIPNLDNLINLKHADLSDNQLTGNLPSLDGLSKLENLFLDGNDLTGKLPDTSVAPNLTNISVDQDDDICQKSSYDYSAYPQLAAYPECASSILGINKKGSGSGSVNTDDGNIVCATHCIAQSFNYPENEQVTLSAVPDAGSVFKSWGGSCRGIEPTISIQMQRSKTCLALFDLEQDENSHLLEVRKKGSGRGSFSIKQAGNLIDVCGESCANKRQHRFPMGNTVDISARAATGSQFTGWTGACEAETLPNISITIDASKSCAAIIDLLPEPPPNMIRLEVGEHENSSGHGKIEMIGINCGNDCEDYIEAGRTVGLKADPDALSSFVSWMGESPQCQAKTTPYLQITPYEDMACYALFNSALDQMAAEEVIEFYEQGELNDDTVLTEEYPPIPINNEHLEYAYRLALSALIQVDEHLAVTGEWPTQFENLQRYLPEPVEFYVESVQIQSRTEINLLDRDVTVVGLFVRVDVVLEHKTGAEELLPILIYYGEEPIEESVVYLSGLNKDTSRRRGRRGRHYGCYPRRRRW